MLAFGVLLRESASVHSETHRYKISVLYVIKQPTKSVLLGIQDPLSLATPASVLILAYQLWQRKKQFTTEFEDKLTDQYRDIVLEIPVEALLDDSDGDRYEGDLIHYYRYLDLTNEQIYLRKEGRVSKVTWESWREGIEAHLERDDFKNAWEDIKDRTKSFNELRGFMNDDCNDDPRYWDPGWRAKSEYYWYSLRKKVSGIFRRTS